jgi:hypothetical protein
VAGLLAFWMYKDRQAHARAAKNAEMLAASVREEQEKAKRIASGGAGATAKLMPPGITSHGGYSSM